MQNIYRGQERRRQYIRVSKQSKDILLQLVFKEGQKIKDAASELKIKYAVAKSIVENKRKKFQRTIQIPSIQKECSFKKISENQHYSYTLIVSQIGEEIYRSEHRIQ